MMKKVRRIIALCMTFLMMMLVVVPVSATTISDLQKQQEELKEKQEEVKKQQAAEQEKLTGISGQISGIEGQADAVAEEIEETDAQLVEIIACVEMIEEDIANKEVQIAETTVKYNEAKAVEDEQYEAMKLRVKFMYEKGDISYMQILLQSGSFSEMVNKAEYVEKLYTYDRELLEEYQLACATTAAYKEQLEEEKSELEAQQGELEEEQTEMEAILEEKQAEYDNYEVQLAQAKQEAAVYKANIKNQAAQLQKLQKDEADTQSQIEAAQKALEEAQAASVSSQSSSSSSGASSSSSGNYASASSYSGSGSKGQQIASYACQFIGNPYVPGGTSLTEGADCSGFIWRIYKDFGYTVPRTSWGCREAGSAVSYSEAQPGDIICYAGHVGLYIGNGQIVHASTQKTGIKITNATYKEMINVRRIV